MPSLDDLKKRIKSVKSTQKITKAMKMVAAAKLRKAQESAEKGRPYSQKMQNIILNLTKSINDPLNAPKLLVGTGQDKTYLCVVLSADRGLCGGFNSNICKLAKTIDCTPAQLLLCWAINKGYCVIPRTTETSWIKENFDSKDVKLTDHIIEELNKLNDGFTLFKKYVYDDD